MPQFQIFSPNGVYRGTVEADDRVNARGKAISVLGLPAGWTLDAVLPGEEPFPDDTLRGGVDEWSGRGSYPGYLPRTVTGGAYD